MTDGRPLEVLLIEDNPGDARLIEEMLRDAADLLHRVEVGGSATANPELHHESYLADGLERLAGTVVDAVLLDLNLPDSAGMETLATVAEAAEWTPIVVLTGLRDEGVGIEAIQEGAQDYLVKDEVTSDLLARSLRHAIERNRQERERAQRREQLERINRLNEISGDVTHAVITTSSREELERAVCERLVASDAYRFAWLGDVERGTDRLSPRVAAGVEEGYLDDITVSVDDEATGQGPAGRAVRTQEVQVMQNVQTEPAFEPWREQAEKRGYRSSAAVPIVHEELLYGVLNVYAAAPNAFSEPERAILGRLGEIIGHAIAAIERKDALVGDTVLELAFRVEGRPDPLVSLSTRHERPIEIQTLVSNDGTVLAYGTAEGVPRGDFEEAVEATPIVDEGRILTPQGDDYTFEVVTDDAASLVEAVGTHGGAVTSATIADGELRFVVEFPPGRDKRQLVELVEDHCPDATNYAQRTVDRTDRSTENARSVFHERLTEKQRTALETAYFAGYFDWPRKSTGQEVADRLGISPATFTQHLRTAERELYSALYDTDDREQK